MFFPPTSGAPARGTLARRPRFAFAGVGFELLGDRPLRLPANVLECCEPLFEATGGLGHVLCSARVDPRIPSFDPCVSFAWRDGETTVVTKGVRARVRAVGDGRFAATALLADGEEATGALVHAVGIAVLAARGGVALHAAGVELSGGAVLFVGPSGAGKTTASLNFPGARVFGLDRVAAYPAGAGRFRASLLPVPSAGRLADHRTDRVSLPLRAVLRVRRASGAPTVRRLDARDALLVARESSLVGDRSRRGESDHLDRLLALAAAVPVGEIHTLRDAPLTGLVSAWLDEGCP